MMASRVRSDLAAAFLGADLAGMQGSSRDCARSKPESGNKLEMRPFSGILRILFQIPMRLRHVLPLLLLAATVFAQPPATPTPTLRPTATPLPTPTPIRVSDVRAA